jgi:predicted O-linked N-acetylglucosamine transferase (SPINDLY family)
MIGSLLGDARAADSAASEPRDVSLERVAENSSEAATDALMRDGVARHMKGDLDAAKAAYQAVLEMKGDHVDALHLLGSVFGQKGQLDPARQLLERALELAPANGEAMVDLGNVYRAEGETNRALQYYQNALGVSPDSAAAHRNIGYVQLEIGNQEQGLEHLKNALTLEPDVLQDQFTLAEALATSGAHAEAIPHYSKALEIKPDLAVAHNHLAFSLSACGSHDAAVKHYRKAIELDPKDYVARNDFGLLLHKFNRREAAAQQFEKTIELNPDFSGGYLNLGNVQRDLQRFAEARRCYEKTLELGLDNPDAHNNLGTLLKDQGRVAEATIHVRRALELRPGFTEAHSNLLMNLQYMDDVTVDALYHAHVDWVSRQIGKGVRPVSDHRNSRYPDRALRIGYLSPDFCTHPVGLFITPVLESHDRSRVHVICYDDLYQGDSVTERLRSVADEWRPIAGLGDDRIAETIRSDEIDILVDLTGHTANNRMRLFAHKPAPVQATWIGYLHSTGLPQMDYLIADAVTVPEDTRQRFSETVVRLPQCFLCYGQPENRPEPLPPPAVANGYVTFGCYNNLAKVSDGTLKLWKRILEHTVNSRLLLKNSVFNDGECRDEYMQKLTALGFENTRLMLEGSSTHGEYFSSYGQIDIALDPSPFSGGTVSADALWMGVPVVTLAGDRMASRTSASILKCLGLDFLVTHDRDAYVNAALSLAEDQAELATLRDGIRRRFCQTALGEPALFTANLETVYRRMWHQWCRQRDGRG